MSLQQIPLSPSYPWPGTSKLPPNLGIGHRESEQAHSPDSQPHRSNGGTRPYSAGGEEALVQRAITGDAEAMEQLFTVNTGRLRQIAFGVLRNREDAEDALQNAFLSACRKLGTFKGQSTFSTWLTSIVINSARMARRKNNSRPESSLDEILDSCPEHLKREIADTRNNPEQTCAEAELKELVEDRVRRLPPRLQTVFRFHTFAGLSLVESSGVLGVRPIALKARLFRAKQHIKKSMRLALRIRLHKSAGHFGRNHKTRGLTSHTTLARRAEESRTTAVHESREDKRKTAR